MNLRLKGALQPHERLRLGNVLSSSEVKASSDPFLLSKSLVKMSSKLASNPENALARVFLTLSFFFSSVSLVCSLVLCYWRCPRSFVILSRSVCESLLCSCLDSNSAISAPSLAMVSYFSFLKSVNLVLGFPRSP